MSDEQLKEISNKLSELLELEKARYPAPIGPKPQIDVWNQGKFITDVPLPPGEWTTIWQVSRVPCPMMLYWKVVVTDTPKVRCLCFQDDLPICHTGCDLAALWTLGITRYNDRGWVHLYDTVKNLYGLQCNILRPITKSYKYMLYNYDTVTHNLILCYPKWYTWERPTYEPYE